MIITVDGMTAAGKTTASAEIARYLGYENYGPGYGILRVMNRHWNEAAKTEPNIGDGMPRFLWRLGLWRLYWEQDCSDIVADEFYFYLFETVRRVNMGGPEEVWKSLYDIMVNALSYMDIKPVCSFYIDITVEESNKRAIDRYIQKHGEIAEWQRCRYERDEITSDVRKFWHWLAYHPKLHIIDGMRPSDEVYYEMLTILQEDYGIDPL